MDHKQGRKTGWTIIICGCFFIILSQLTIGLIMAALGVVFIIMTSRCPHCGKVLFFTSTKSDFCPKCHGPL